MDTIKPACQDEPSVILASLTCERLASFTRSLETLASAFVGKDADGQDIKSVYTRLLVCDDSALPETIEAKKALLAAKSRQWKCSGLFCGLQEKREYAQNIKRVLLESRSMEDAQLSAVDFMFFGSNDLSEFKAPGANQNSQLALSAGSRLLSFDDDVFACPRQLKENCSDNSNKAVGIVSGAFHTEAAFNEISEAWTGNPWNALTEKLGTRCSYTDAAGKKAELLIRSANAGLYGTSWFDVPFSLLTIKQPFRYSIEADKKSYSDMLARPYAFTQSSAFLVPSPLTIAAAISIDTTALLPPFLPHIRMQEHVWQTMLEACHPLSCTAALPFMLFHNRESKNSFTSEDYRNVGATLGRHVLSVMNGLIATSRIEAPDSPADYHYFGQAFLELSELSYRDWLVFCRRIWAESVVPGIGSFQQLLDEQHRKPRYWARDVEKFISRLIRGMNEPEDFVPRELQTTGSAAAAHETWQHLFNHWGQLLLCWPDIWHAIEQWHKTESPWTNHY